MPTQITMKVIRVSPPVVCKWRKSCKTSRKSPSSPLSLYRLQFTHQFHMLLFVCVCEMASQSAFQAWNAAMHHHIKFIIILDYYRKPFGCHWTKQSSATIQLRVNWYAIHAPCLARTPPRNVVIYFEWCCIQGKPDAPPHADVHDQYQEQLLVSVSPFSQPCQDGNLKTQLKPSWLPESFVVLGICPDGNIFPSWQHWINLKKLLGTKHVVGGGMSRWNASVDHQTQYDLWLKTIRDYLMDMILFYS